jgi:hypothetical protein
MTDKVNNTNPETENSGYEKSDVKPGKIILFGILGVVLIVIMLVFITQLFSTTSERMVEEMVLRPQSTAIRELRARETEELNSYKLLDAQKGIYQIPIDRAIKLMADEAYREKKKSNNSNQD